MSAFFDISKDIANDYLQSIVFLDDRALPKKTEKEDELAGHNLSQHAFDTFEVSKVFAKEKKICAVYNPLVDEDIENFIQISKKADVVILDWFIVLNDGESKSDRNDEEDDEEDDPRGKYTKRIIKELVNDPEFGNDSLKLVVVYTGEDIIEDISVDIYNEINSDATPFALLKEECRVQSKNIKILIRCKAKADGEDTRFNQRPHLKDKVLLYDELPAFVLNEFTEMTSGLLSNFALLSLTTIRRNSHKILSLFSKDLDSAYLGHKALLPVQNESESLLIDLFSDTISDLLYNKEIAVKLQDDLIENWIISNINNERLYQANKFFQRTPEFISLLLKSTIENVEERITTLITSTTLSKADKKKYVQNCTSLFLNSDKQDQNELINIKFAILSQHKSLFLPQNIQPRLTLGTIIRSTKKPEQCLICIQQRCDSVRLDKNKPRKFLFLPLIVVGSDKFDIITPEGIKLKLQKKSFSLRTIQFECDNDEGVIKAEMSEDSKYIFKQIYVTEDDEQFEWLLDLKDLHSQRIVSNYASELSRVGIDQFEWLRMSSN
ncbi:MAG: response regulator receiver domain [Paludibacter sp.]|nr:response regulator receiver domain [Paludibacter sp.]